jgi:hypothetical protein
LKKIYTQGYRELAPVSCNVGYVQACAQFGRANIDLLLSNKLLENRGSYKAKKRFYIADIVSGLEILRRNEKDR